jgi:uncharacterized Zn-finger protein
MIMLSRDKRPVRNPEKQEQHLMTQLEEGTFEEEASNIPSQQDQHQRPPLFRSIQPRAAIQSVPVIPTCAGPSSPPKTTAPRQSSGLMCTFPGCKNKKVFARTSTLNHHMRIHGEPTFICDDCPASFVFEKDLTKHITTHSDERPWPCTWAACPKVFSRKDNMQRHARSPHPVSTESSV